MDEHSHQFEIFNIFPLLPPAPVHASRLPPSVTPLTNDTGAGVSGRSVTFPSHVSPRGRSITIWTPRGFKHLIHTSEIVTENGHWTQHWQRVSCWPAWLALFVVSLILLKIVMTVLHWLKDYERQTGGVWPSCADAKSAWVMKCEGHFFHLKRKINEKLFRPSRAFSKF